MVSYKNAPHATETFKELTSPKSGKDALWSTMFKTDLETPLPSDPMIIASGWFKSKS